MGRFLIFFSYLGTRYSGIQEQVQVSIRGKPLRTVAGALKEALKCLKPSNDFKITLSSRTDKGVHALKNACHVTLDYPSPGQEYNPLVVTHVLNNYLQRQEEDIRVLQTRQVPWRFNSRFHACRRHYVYRLGHIIDEGALNELQEETFYGEIKKFASKKSPHAKLPLGEQLSTLDACKAVVYRSQLDIDKMISAAEMISGIHDFSQFTSRRNPKGDYQPHPVKMLAIGVKRGQPFGHQLQKCGLDVARGFEFWDIHVQSKSFLFRQIRKIVGTMVLVGQNKLSLEELRDLFNDPLTTNPKASQNVAKESGLFLLNVEYNQKDMEFVPGNDLLEQESASQSSLSCDAAEISSATQGQDVRIIREVDVTDSEESSGDDNIGPAASSDKVKLAGLRLGICSKGVAEIS